LHNKKKKSKLFEHLVKVGMSQKIEKSGTLPKKRMGRIKEQLTKMGSSGSNGAA